MTEEKSELQQWTSQQVANVFTAAQCQESIQRIHRVASARNRELEPHEQETIAKYNDALAIHESRRQRSSTSLSAR